MALCYSTDTFWLVRPLAHRENNQCRWKLASKKPFEIKVSDAPLSAMFWLLNGNRPKLFKN